MYFMELALGQYHGQGPTRLYGRMAPAFKVHKIHVFAKFTLFTNSHFRKFTFYSKLTSIHLLNSYFLQNSPFPIKFTFLGPIICNAQNSH